MIVVDVETTGISPYKHGIISIGAIEFENPTNQFYVECRIDEKTLVDSYALSVNGFTLEQIKDSKKPTQADAARQFLLWTNPIKDKTIGGHNTSFDIAMLRAAFKKANLEVSLFYGLVDMHNIAYAQMKRVGAPIPINRYGFFSAKADHIHKYVGLPEEPMPHHGLTGAKMEAEAMSRLIYGKNLLPEFAKYKLPKQLLA